MIPGISLITKFFEPIVSAIAARFWRPILRRFGITEPQPDWAAAMEDRLSTNMSDSLGDAIDLSLVDRAIAEKYMAVGRALFDSERFADSIDQLRAAFRPELPSEERYLIHNLLGDAYRIRGDLVHARAEYTEMTRLAERESLKGKLAFAYVRISIVERLENRLDASFALCERAGNLFAEVGIRRGVADALAQRAAVLMVSERYEQALVDAQAAFDIFLSVDATGAAAAVLGTTGLTLKRQGKPQEALAAQEEALRMNRAIGRRTGEAIALNNIAACYIDLRDDARALPLLDQARTIYAAVGHRSGMADVDALTGLALRSLGEYDRSLQFYQRALTTHLELENLRKAAAEAMYMGFSARLLGRFEDAEKHLNFAIDLATRVEDHYVIGQSLGNLALIAEQRSRIDEALKLAEGALHEFRQRGIASDVDRAQRLVSRYRAIPDHTSLAS